MEFFNNSIYGNSIKDWLIALAIFLATVLFAKSIFYIFKKLFQKLTEKTRTKIDDIILEKSRQPFIILTLLIAGRYALSGLYFELYTADFISKFFTFSFIIVFTWLGSRVIEALISEYFQNLTEENEKLKKDSVSPVLRKSARFLIWIPGSIMALNNAGLDVGALIAGLGIGGLAVALASQDTVKNVIGGLIILFDKPFGIGDHIQVDNFNGHVEDIGLRSTRIRSTDGKEVSIPNTLFSDKPITNISREKESKVITNLNLSYANQKENTEQLCKMLMEMLSGNEKLVSNKTEVVVSSFEESHIKLTIQYFIKKGSHYSAVKNEINLKVWEILLKSGIQLAVQPPSE